MKKFADQSGLELPLGKFRVIEVPFSVPRILGFLRKEDIARYKQAKDRRSTGFFSFWVWKLIRRFQDYTGIFSAVRMPDITDLWIRPALRWSTDQGPWDVAVSLGFPYSAHIVTWRLKKRGKVRRWAADFRDLWTRHHAFRGVFPLTVVERVIERQIFKYADLLTTVSSPLANTLKKQSGRRTFVIFNGYSETLNENLPSESIFPNDGAIRLVHTGTLYPLNMNLEPLMEAIRSLKAEIENFEARFRFVVAGSRGAIWLDTAERYCISGCFDYRGVVPRHDALRMQRDADALLMLSWCGRNAGVLTSRIFEYLPWKTPIIAVGSSCHREIEQILQETDRGIFVGDSKDLIEEFLSRLLASPAAMRRDGRQSAIQNYSRRFQAAKYRQLIETM